MSPLNTKVLFVIWISACCVYASEADVTTINKACDCGEHSSTCQFAGDDKVCVCQDNFVLKDGICVALDPCTNNPCRNGGVCQVNGEDFLCACKEPFKGKQCETHPCHENPCLNDGACIAVEGHYGCVCNEPFTGQHCEKDPCSSGPCYNGGVCSVHGLDFNCTCQTEFSGRLCEIVFETTSLPDRTESARSTRREWITTNSEIPYSEPTTLTSNETTTEDECSCGENSLQCILNRYGEKVCRCKDHYAQRNDKCQETCWNDDDCFYNGRCQREGAGYFCQCADKYVGDKCQTDVCEPVKRKCSAMGAECRRKGDTGVCECPQGTVYSWITEKCDDICDFRTCVFGKCEIVGNVTYICICDAGFTGRLCDRRVEEIVTGPLLMYLVMFGGGISVFTIAAIIACCWVKKLNKRIAEDSRKFTYA